MARMPGAVWLGEHSPRREMYRYDIVCVHTIVGYAPAHAAHFSTKADGTILQSRDTAFQSAANLDGNHRIIAVENEDHGPAFGGTPKLPGWVPLTDAQVEAIGRILRWANRTHGVPLQLCPNSKPLSRGLAYHRQGIDGNFGGFRFPGRVPGGETWTLSPGKVCPTDVRIAQLPDILRYAQEGDDVDFDDKIRPDDPDSPTLGQILSRMERFIERSDVRAKAMRERDLKILAALDVLEDSSSETATKAQIQRLRDIIGATDPAEEPEETP